MKAIILSAGQGRRLLPWTHDLPKCLLPFGRRPLLSWQLLSLQTAGITEVVVVTGFAAQEVEREIHHAPPGMSITPLFNPFFGVADNIASCWAAREHLHGDVVVINGDTLFEPSILTRTQDSSAWPLTLATDAKPSYDADDMKIQRLGDKVVRVGKTLPAEATDGEAIGLLVLKEQGGPLFVAAIETVMRQPRGVARWYLSAVDDLAIRGHVGASPITGLGWTEVDYPGDLGRAESLVRGWSSLQNTPPVMGNA